MSTSVVITPTFIVGTFPSEAGPCCCGGGAPPIGDGCCCYCAFLPSVLTLTFTSGPWGTETVTLTQTTTPTGGGTYPANSHVWQGTTTAGDVLTLYCTEGAESEWQGVATISAWIWWCDPVNQFEFSLLCDLDTGIVASDTGYGGIGGVSCNVGTVGAFNFEISGSCNDADCSGACAQLCGAVWNGTTAVQGSPSTVPTLYPGQTIYDLYSGIVAIWWIDTGHVEDGTRYLFVWYDTDANLHVTHWSWSGAFYTEDDSYNPCEAIDWESDPLILDSAHGHDVTAVLC